MDNINKKNVDELIEYLGIVSPENRQITLKFEDKTSLAVFLKDIIDRDRKVRNPKQGSKK